MVHRSGMLAHLSNLSQRRKQPTRTRTKKNPKSLLPWPTMLDRGLGSGSSASSSATNGGDVQARAFMEAFMEYAKEKEQVLPPALQVFVQPNVKDNLRSQQKRLNKHRGLLQKIEAKKRAIQRDQEQWTKWTSDMKGHIACQRKRHQEQEEKLQSELQELEKEEEALRNMKDPEEEEVVTIPEGDEDIEDIFDEAMEDVVTKKMTDMEKSLEKKQKELEEEYQRRYQLACTQMEQQFQAQLLSMVNVAPPPGFGDQQKEMQVAANTPVKKSVGPFQRAQKGLREAITLYQKHREGEGGGDARRDHAEEIGGDARRRRAQWPRMIHDVGREDWFGAGKGTRSLSMDRPLHVWLLRCGRPHCLHRQFWYPVVFQEGEIKEIYSSST